MAKRGIGERANSLFDSIDLQILRLLEQTKDYVKPLGILEIAERLNITHKNLKPHIDKLISLDLISTIKVNDKFEIRSTLHSYEIMLDIEEDSNELKEIEKRYEDYKKILSILSKANGYFFDIEAKKSFGLDLRKLKTQEKLSNKNKQATPKEKDTP